MPVEFALRPRIRLREDPAPRAPSRRTRVRLPRFALPVAGYWAAVGGICYGIIRFHDAPSPEPASDTRELAAEAAPPTITAPPTDAPGPQEPPAREPPLNEARALVPTTEPSLEPDPEPRVEAEQPVRPRGLGADVSAALLASRTPQAEQQPVPRHRERSLTAQASDADSLDALDSQPVSAIEPRPAPSLPRGSGASLPSCEAAAAAAVQDLDFASGDRTADLPSEAIAGVLENGAWLSSCSLPSTTKLDVCVAIKAGRVTAATVTSRPSDPALNACVKQRAAALQFPYSTRVDVARTRF
ncbi:MAG: hypothetical protein ABI488_24920 [Polyangiaceae bacterium]